MVEETHGWTFGYEIFGLRPLDRDQGKTGTRPAMLRPTEIDCAFEQNQMGRVGSAVAMAGRHRRNRCAHRLALARERNPIKPPIARSGPSSGKQ